VVSGHNLKRFLDAPIECIRSKLLRIDSNLPLRFQHERSPRLREYGAAGLQKISEHEAGSELDLVISIVVDACDFSRVPSVADACAGGTVASIPEKEFYDRAISAGSFSFHR
jgi:hypothetical protein